MLYAAKSKRKAIRSGNTLWSITYNLRVHTKINQQVKESLYKCILYHTQVVQCAIVNDFIYLSIDGNSKKQLVKDFYYKFIQ